MGLIPMESVTRETEAPLPELLLGEVPTWNVGVCRIEAQIAEGDGRYRPVKGGMAEEPDRLVVLGENDMQLHAVEAWRGFSRIDREISEAIASEMDEL